MTEQEYQAGRELDALIADRVFGWVWVEWSVPRDPTLWVKGLVPLPANHINYAFNPSARPASPETERAGSWDQMPWNDQRLDYRESLQIGFPRYSTEIAAAWQVVEAMAERGLFINLYIPAHESIGQHECDILRKLDEDAYPTVARKAAAYMPLAICRAALAALEVQP